MKDLTRATTYLSNIFTKVTRYLVKVPTTVFLSKGVTHLSSYSEYSKKTLLT